MQKDFLSIRDLSVYEFHQMLDRADEVKKHPDKYRKALKNKILAMIFQKPSLRTRMTFEAGMLQLGGEAIYLAPSDIQMGRREGAYDIGKNLERWVDGIMIRTFAHQIAVDLAASSEDPGHQRPDRPLPSLPGHGRLPHPAGAQGRAVHAQADLRRRRQQRLPQPHAGRGPRRDEDGRGHAGRLRAEARRSSRGPARTAGTPASP